MKITKEEVEHVAHLARLELDDTAIERFADQIGNILAYVDKLKQVDTEGIVPTSHAITLTNAFREDEVNDHLDRERIAGQCAGKGRRNVPCAEGNKIATMAILIQPEISNI